MLRVHRPWVTQARLSQLQQIKHLLFNAGFPVPLPLPTSSGETILSDQGRLVEMEPFIIHDGEADTWERNAIAFSFLGRLHASLALLLEGYHLINPVVSNYAVPEQLLSWTQQAVEASARSQHTLKAREKQHALSLYAEAISMLLFLQKQWNRVKEVLPKQLTHADFGGGNLLFRDEHPVAILDFDFMRIRERVSEIAYTLYWWLCKQGHGQIAVFSSWQRAKELLRAYNEGTSKPLILEELRVLPLEMARVPLYWIAETHFFPNPAQKVIENEVMIANAHWILEHCDQLIDLFVHSD